MSKERKIRQLPPARLDELTEEDYLKGLKRAEQRALKKGK